MPQTCCAVLAQIVRHRPSGRAVRWVSPEVLEAPAEKRLSQVHLAVAVMVAPGFEVEVALRDLGVLTCRFLPLGRRHMLRWHWARLVLLLGPAASLYERLEHLSQLVLRPRRHEATQLEGRHFHRLFAMMNWHLFAADGCRRGGSEGRPD